MGIVGELGQFIPGQVIRRLRVPDGMESALLEYFQGRGVSSGWEAEDSEEEHNGDLVADRSRNRQFGINHRFEDARARELERIWPRESSRHAFLADKSLRRIVISTPAGVGKSSAVGQLEYVTRRLHPEQLVLRIEMKDVPTKRIGGKREFIHKGVDSILFQKILDDVTDAKKLVTETLGRHSSLPNIDATNRDSRLLPWLKASLQRGQDTTLIIDSFDEVDLNTARDQAFVLREFLELFPQVRCIVAGRPHSIVKLWGRDELNLGAIDDGTRRPEWEFVRIDRYTQDQLTKYLGTKKTNAAGMLDSDEIRVPRIADVVRRIPSADLNKMENASDLYWYTQRESLKGSLKRAREIKSFYLNDTEVMMVAAAVAFGLWSWQSTPIMHVASSGESSWSDFKNYLEDIGISKRLATAGIKLKDALQELAKVNTDPLRFDAYNESGDLPGVEFSDATIRDFYAAHWMARFLDKKGWKKQQARLWSRRRGEEFEKAWELLNDFPVQPIARNHGEPSKLKSWCRAIETLFRRGEKDKVFGDNRLMYLAWRPLLTRAHRMPHRKSGYQEHLRKMGFNEQEIGRHKEEGLDNIDLAVDEATVWFQQEAEEAFRRGGWSSSKAAERVLYDFLVDYKRQRDGEVSDVEAKIIWEDLEGDDRWGNCLWRKCDSATGKRVWIGHEKKYRHPLRQITLQRSFELCAFQVTTQLFSLFDARHTRRFSDYNKFAPAPRCPKIFTNFYNAMMFAYWTGGVLLTSTEWEYVSLGRVFKNRETSRYFFGDYDDELPLHAWLHENSNDQTKEVGHRPIDGLATSEFPDTRNGFGLYDILGNVFEWCLNRYKDEYNDELDTRSVRGRSVLSDGLSENDWGWNNLSPTHASEDIGFRVARAKPRKPQF